MKLAPAACRRPCGRNKSNPRPLTRRGWPVSIGLLSDDNSTHRAVHAPDLVNVVVGPNAFAMLESTQQDLRRFGIDVAVPTLILPPGGDPADYQWPVEGRTVRVLGILPRSGLLQLMQRLMLNGALTVVGLDESGNCHVAHHPETDR
jgi:hypothetical protein